MDKTLIFVRHAHRDKDQGRLFDNGLSKKGKKQALLLADYFEKRFFNNEDTVLLSSPKKRCCETLQPLCRKIRSKLKLEPLLLELDEGEGESPENFVRRVQTFCEMQKNNSDRLIVACSHGDWIPIALQYLVGTTTQLKKGAWAEIEIENMKPNLRWLIQRFEPEI